MTAEKMQQFSQKLAGIILARLRTTFKRKPSRQAIETELQNLLEAETSNISLAAEDLSTVEPVGKE